MMRMRAAANRIYLVIKLYECQDKPRREFFLAHWIAYGGASAFSTDNV